MHTVLRTILLVAGLALAVFGGFCLNYTKAWTLERHMEFAASHKLPPPSRTIFYGGVVAVAVGAGIVGYAAASQQRNRAEH